MVSVAQHLFETGHENSNQAIWVLVPVNNFRKTGFSPMQRDFLSLIFFTSYESLL